jgi:hypothetical protein
VYFERLLVAEVVFGAELCARFSAAVPAIGAFLRADSLGHHPVGCVLANVTDVVLLQPVAVLGGLRVAEVLRLFELLEELEAGHGAR